MSHDMSVGPLALLDLAPGEELRHSGLLALMHSPLSTPEEFVLINEKPFGYFSIDKTSLSETIPSHFWLVCIRSGGDLSLELHCFISHSDVPVFDSVQD